MKRSTSKYFIIGLLLMAIVFTSNFSFAAPLTQDRQNAINNDFRGLWVATVLNLDYPTKATTDSEVLKSEALKIINKAESLGMNAIVLQVRPSGDAFYKSDIYPWSKYLTGKQGVAPTNDFDPLAYWIDEAHKRGIAVHAWVNPYRITRKNAADPAHDYTQLAANHPAKLHPEWVVAHTDGNLYFNPGLPEVRQHITDSIMEIVNKYDIDGIHFDDYFYPSTTFNDATAFTTYGKSFTNIADWRRNNVDELIKSVYAAIKAKKPTVQFGISPFGIWANAKNNPAGSATNGFESYYSQYADTKKWVEQNMIDYIAPQLYWNIGYSVADYSKLLTWWSDVAKDSKVNLYIGHAAYRVGNADISSPWYGVDEIYRQLALNKTKSNVKGSIFFRYAFFNSNSALSTLVTDYYKGGNLTPTQEQLVIGRPYRDVQTTASNYFIGGASDPRTPVYLNGQEIKIRTAQGYFGVYVPLITGENVFTLTQNGKTTTRKITNVAPALAAPMAKIEIIPSSTWPQTATSKSPNEEVTLFCRAPIGATVTATLNGMTYTLTPSSTNVTTKPYATSYSFKTTLPSPTGTPRVVDLGKVVYKMVYKGISYSAESKVPVSVIMNGAPYIGTITKNNADTFDAAYSSNGAMHMLHLGMKDYVVAENGDYIKFASGIWVTRSNVALTNGTLNPNSIEKINYINATKFDVVAFSMKEKAIATANYSAGKLSVTFEQTVYGAPLSLPMQSMIKEATVKTVGNKTTYEFTLNEPSKLGGYYLESSDTGITLIIKKKFVAMNGSQLPLKGATIVIDPGHGGSDSGAIGLLGTLKPEKAVAMEHALLVKANLEALGANVVMTRTSDVYLSLSGRLVTSKAYSPDLFISIHADSLEDTADLTKVSGATVYYKDPLAKGFADAIKAGITAQTSRVNRGAKVMNFYVIRGTWTPSVLIETGFMPNPNDFQALTDSYEQARFATMLSQAVLNYFKQ